MEGFLQCLRAKALKWWRCTCNYWLIGVWECCTCDGHVSALFFSLREGAIRRVKDITRCRQLMVMEVKRRTSSAVCKPEDGRVWGWYMCLTLAVGLSVSLEYILKHLQQNLIKCAWLFVQNRM